MMAPVALLLQRWLNACGVIIDPFARDSKWGTIRNDLNPNTSAEFHLHAEEFCDRLLRDGCQADAVLFDPPYSPRQIAEIYQQVGIKATRTDTQNARFYRCVRDRLDALLRPGGVAISCGWNSIGFGIGRCYELAEVLLISHGGAHNDTIVTVERKRQGGLFHSRDVDGGKVESPETDHSGKPKGKNDVG